MSQQQVKFEGGALRSEVKPRYDLMPLEALQALAERLGFGAASKGDRNWMNGGPEFFRETANHLFEHLMKYMSGDTSEDHPAAIICNAAFVCWWERVGKAAWYARELDRCNHELEGAKSGILDWEAEKFLIERAL